MRDFHQPRRARARSIDEHEPVAPVMWVIAGLTSLWALSFLARLLAA
jgi:hypothetical protein